MADKGWFPVLSVHLVKALCEGTKHITRLDMMYKNKIRLDMMDRKKNQAGHDGQKMESSWT